MASANSWTEEYLQQTSGGDLAVTGQYTLQADFDYKAMGPGDNIYLLTRVASGYNNGVQLCLTNTGTSSSPAYTLALQDCANGSGPIDNLYPTTISAGQMAQYDPSGSGWVTVKLDVNGDRYTAFLGQSGSTAVPMVEQFTLLDGFGRLAGMGPSSDIGPGGTAYNPQAAAQNDDVANGYTGGTVGWGSCLFSIPATAPGYDPGTGNAYVIRNLSMNDIQPPNWTDVMPISDLTAVDNSDGSIDLSWQNNSANATSYDVWGSADGENWTWIASVSSGTSYTASADTASKFTYFDVVADPPGPQYADPKLDASTQSAATQSSPTSRPTTTRATPVYTPVPTFVERCVVRPQTWDLFRFVIAQVTLKVTVLDQRNNPMPGVTVSETVTFPTSNHLFPGASSRVITGVPLTTDATGSFTDYQGATFTTTDGDIYIQQTLTFTVGATTPVARSSLPTSTTH